MPKWIHVSVLVLVPMILGACMIASFVGNWTHEGLVGVAYVAWSSRLCRDLAAPEIITVGVEAIVAGLLIALGYLLLYRPYFTTVNRGVWVSANIVSMGLYFSLYYTFQTCWRAAQHIPLYLLMSVGIGGAVAGVHRLALKQAYPMWMGGSTVLAVLLANMLALFVSMLF
jgi:hypothetical protein